MPTKRKQSSQAGKGFVGDLVKMGRKSLVNLARDPVKGLAQKGLDAVFDKLAGSGQKMIHMPATAPRVVSYEQKPVKATKLVSVPIKGGRASISGGKAYIRRTV